MTGYHFDVLLAVYECRKEERPIFERVLGAMYSGDPWDAPPQEWLDAHDAVHPRNHTRVMRALNYLVTNRLVVRRDRRTGVSGDSRGGWHFEYRVNTALDIGNTILSLAGMKDLLPEEAK